ncbi:uncharacterized protein LAJ45_10448 [Morchella importuna]|uniref:uncharacterized protein n=1 Tax=Morchella importuna TaxID=1174673 RepID=UPI001E8CB18A|nr:uncharacterized protein LAJ45_10448 [Morchella importuna]KAH8145478.1 hypothetical protein LAJ45_10448 [Morchella importuna]
MASPFQVGLVMQGLPSINSGLLPSITKAFSATWAQLTRSSEASKRTIYTQTAPLVKEEAQYQKINDSVAELPAFLKAYPGLRNQHVFPSFNGTPMLAGQILRSAFGNSRASAFSTLTGATRHLTSLPASSFNKISPPVPRLPGQSFARGFLSFSGLSQNALYRAEQAANNNSQNPAAQEKFYETLLRANLPQYIIDRYQTGQYATNRACEDKYIKALERTGQFEKARLVADRRGDFVENPALSGEEIQAIGQAVAAQSRGGNFAMSRGNATSGYSGTGARETPIHVVVDESIGGTIFKWIKFLFYFGLTAYFLLVFLTLAIEATGMMKKVAGTNSNEAQAAQQTARFSDVHGCDEAKEELQELVEFLRDPSQFSTLGGKLPKGVLLVGPPGTGKTLLARAVAGEAGVPFFFMSGSEFDEVYVGVGAKRVRELFAQARAKAPAIVFIDELDAIGGKRNERDAAYVKQTLNQLLVDLDGFSQNSGVIFLAATNFPQLLDKALTRPGRFDRNVTVPLPDVLGRIAILKHHTKSIQVNPSIDLSILARGTPGFSGAELENMCNQAAVRASRQKATSVRMEDFDWAKDRIMMGAERRSAVIPLEERKMTAYHEGGHALVGMFTEGHMPVYKVTIMPRGQALGVTHFLPEGDKYSWSKKQILAHIDSSLGGKIAEELIYGTDNVTGGCSSDLMAATRYARRMVMELGMSPVVGDVNMTEDYQHLSTKTKELIETEVRRIIEESRGRVTTILQKHRKELDLLAKALVEYESLSYDEMKKVIAGETLPHKLKILPNVPIKLPETGGSFAPPLEGSGAAAAKNGEKEF